MKGFWSGRRSSEWCCVAVYRYIVLLISNCCHCLLLTCVYCPLDVSKSCLLNIICGSICFVCIRI